MDTKTKSYFPNKVRRRKERKDAKQARLERGEVIAHAKYLKIAPRKARLVADVIRGKKAEDAINVLRFTTKKAAKFLEKVVESAVANAENNHQLNSDDLYVYRVFVDEGPVVRRIRARAQGRAVPVRHRTSHITVVVKERGEGK